MLTPSEVEAGDAAVVLAALTAPDKGCAGLFFCLVEDCVGSTFECWSPPETGICRGARLSGFHGQQIVLVTARDRTSRMGGRVCGFHTERFLMEPTSDGNSRMGGRVCGFQTDRFMLEPARDGTSDWR